MRNYEKEDDIERLEHIQNAISGIETLLLSKEREGMHERALERYFEIIGEACNKISKNLQGQYPDIPWGNIISLRNIIIHEYDKVVTETLWDIAEHKIPALHDWIEGVLEKLKP